MDNEPKKNQTENRDAQPYSFSDIATKNKIKKHLSDINDVITEEDIANAKVPGEEDPITPPGDYKEKSEKENLDEKTEDRPITPWDVVK
ncbi:MAG: hypothetical protein ACSLE0_11315 [Chitinophagaceae bacterium]